MTSSVDLRRSWIKVDTYDESWVLRMFIWGLPQDQAVLVSQGKPTLTQSGFPASQGCCFGRPDGKAPRN